MRRRVFPVARAVLLERACLPERGSDMPLDFQSVPVIRGWRCVRDPFFVLDSEVWYCAVMTNTALYLRLLAHVKPYRRVFALGIAGMVVLAATERDLRHSIERMPCTGNVRSVIAEHTDEMQRRARRSPTTARIVRGLGAVLPVLWRWSSGRHEPRIPRLPPTTRQRDSV